MARMTVAEVWLFGIRLGSDMCMCMYVCIFMHVHICDLSILTRESIIKAFGRPLWETSHPS